MYNTNIDGTVRSLGSANTLPDAYSSPNGPGGSADQLGGTSGLFGKPRAMRMSSSGSGAPMASTKFVDPFMTHGPDVGIPMPPGDMDESTPLQSSRDSGLSKAIVIPSIILIAGLTIVSGIAVALSFSDTGRKAGSEEGHLDGANEQSGCQSLFYWVVFQFLVDLIILCALFSIGMSGSGDSAGMFGCCASFRLFVLAAGFHILYFSGLERPLCNEFLVTWSTIVTWIGIALMGLVSCHLGLLVLGASGSRKQPPPQDIYRQPMPPV